MNFERLVEPLQYGFMIKAMVAAALVGAVCAVLSQRDLFRGALLRALGFGGRAEDKMLKQIAVKEIMSDQVHTAPPDTPVAEAARLMTERKIGCLPVVEGGKLVGLVTETDFVRLIAEGR